MSYDYAKELGLKTQHQNNLTAISLSGHQMTLLGTVDAKINSYCQRLSGKMVVAQERMPYNIIIGPDRNMTKLGPFTLDFENQTLRIGSKSVPMG